MSTPPSIQQEQPGQTPSIKEPPQPAPPAQNSSKWGVLNIFVLAVLLIDLLLLTLYFWSIPQDKFEHFGKVAKTLTEWLTAIVGFLGYKFGLKRELAVPAVLREMPIVVFTAILTIIVIPLILPFYHVTLTVEADGKALSGVTVMVDAESKSRFGGSDEHGLLKITDLLPASHHIHVEKKPEYESQDHTATFLQVLLMKRIKLPLKRAEATATIDTTPEGADIYVDGSKVGRTEKILPLTIGTHSIEFKMPGYRIPSKEIINIVTTEPYHPPPWKLERILEWKSLNVDSFPHGAEIYVDKQSKSKGATPATIRLLAGEHTIELKKDGMVASGTVSIPKDKGFSKRLDK